MQLKDFLNGIQFVRTDDDPPVIVELNGGRELAIDYVERDTNGGPIIIVLKPVEQR